MFGGQEPAADFSLGYLSERAAADGQGSCICALLRGESLIAVALDTGDQEIDRTDDFAAITGDSVDDGPEFVHRYAGQLGRYHEVIFSRYANVRRECL
jgi:hypothetical protein